MALNIKRLCHFAECCILFTIMLNVIMLSVVMLTVIMLSVIMLSVIMLSVIMLSVVMLTAIMLVVIAPTGNPYGRGRLSTVDLLVQTSFDQHIFIWNILFKPLLQNELPY